MEEDPIMEYGEKFRRRISMSDLAENYERWKRMQQEEARRIKDSSEARKYIIKYLGKKDPLDLLEVSCRCIYDLTGDTYFEKYTRELIQELRKDNE